MSLAGPTSKAACAPQSAVAGPGRYRWIVVGLLFLAMVINYVDRQMIGFLKPDYLQPEFGWSERDFANIVFWFQAAYAGSYLLFGRVIDRVGAKLGFAAAFTIWTIAHIAHSGARTITQFILIRMLLGIGEGGAFPGGIKAVTEWFPKRERAFATGLFNAGTNIGAIVTPLIVPWIVIDLDLGWRASFFIVGVATLLWLPAWLWLYSHPRKNKNVTPGELAFIESDPPDVVENVSWLRVIRTRETWGYAIGKFLIDPVWWMFLFWLPDFLKRTYGLDLKRFGPPIIVIYLLSDVGSIGGGWLSSMLMKRGMSLNAARKATMLICALCAVPVMFAATASSLWVAVAIIGLATAAHQGFSANLYTLPGDVFPRSAVATVIGVGGMLGGIGGMVFAKYVGEILERIGTYTPIFIVAGSVYLIALLVVHLLMPRLAPVKFEA
jgi:ACS family hexuronate transporter-like MFS transporter